MPTFSSLQIEARSITLPDTSFDGLSIESNDFNLDSQSLDSISIEFSPSVNWIIYVQDADGNAIEGVDVEINATNYITDSNGKVDVPNIDGNVLTLMTMSKVGYQTYTHNLISTEDAIFYQTLNKIVPFVVNSKGETIINTQPDNPTNNRFI